MNWNSKDFIKKRVAKNFDGQVYFGVVKKWVPASENDEGVDLWLVEYVSFSFPMISCQIT